MSLYINNYKAASLDVDPQKGFTSSCPDELPVEGGNEIAEECNKNAKYTRFRYLSKDAHPENGIWTANEKDPQFSKVLNQENVDIRWNKHCVVGTEGFELIDGFPHPSEYDFIVYKGVERDMHPYSPVYHDLKKKISTGIIEKANRDGVETFVLGGLALNFCVKEAALDLRKAGFRVIINLAATRAIEGVDDGIEMMKKERIEFINNADELDDLPF
jgi:nicotinamidase/pyrazinamidase